jgi:hypothetical protein
LRICLFRFISTAQNLRNRTNFERVQLLEDGWKLCELESGYREKGWGDLARFDQDNFVQRVLRVLIWFQHSDESAIVADGEKDCAAVGIVNEKLKVLSNLGICPFFATAAVKEVE